MKQDIGLSVMFVLAVLKKSVLNFVSPSQHHGDTLGTYVEQYGGHEILDLSDASFQQKLEQIKDQIKKEIRKELKIKEGAENMRKVTTDKKSLANVNNLVKQANARLQELQQELNELNARIVVNTEDMAPSGKNNLYVHLLLSSDLEKEKDERSVLVPSECTVHLLLILRRKKMKV